MDLIPKWLLQKWPPRLHEPDPPRLWKIGYALIACFVAALAGLVVLWRAALALLGHPKLPQSKVISLHDKIGVAQLVFASVAGAGALVALVMAYRRQRVTETATMHDRTRVLNERFTTIAAQLGDDQAAVRLAGVHAMAGLADDWKENRQTCIDVLCAYLRMPYEPVPGDEARAAERLAFQATREVRHTVIRVITAHLIKDAPVSWQGLNFDFTGVVFDGGDFYRTEFSGGTLNFTGARFSGGQVSFLLARFSGGTVRFDNAVFTGGGVSFNGAKFSGGRVSFDHAIFAGGTVSFLNAVFSSGGRVNFDGAKFFGAEVTFFRAQFSGGTVRFYRAEFSGGRVSFPRASFTGGDVSLLNNTFSGGRVDFSGATDWSHPPEFGWKGTPPTGVKLPAAHNDES